MEDSQKVKAPKKYWVKTVRSDFRGRNPDRVNYVSGTIEELLEYYGYTLEIGHSWNSKINTKPTTIKSFVSNLQKSYSEKEGACYTRTFVEQVKENEVPEEFKKQESVA